MSLTNKKLHPLIVDQIKWYLLKNFEISLDTLTGFDKQIKILGNKVCCDYCQSFLTNDWKMCKYCPNIVCRDCYNCLNCEY